MSIYSWTPGSRVSVKASDAGEEIEAIYASFLKVTPGIMVEWAADESSALHDAFEWDDYKASHQWRLHQGRNILSAIRVQREGDTEPRVMNVAVKMADGERAYQKVEVAVEDMAMWDRVMMDTRSQLKGLERRLKDLESVESGERKEVVVAVRGSVTEAIEFASASG